MDDIRKDYKLVIEINQLTASEAERLVAEIASITGLSPKLKPKPKQKATPKD